MGVVFNWPRERIVEIQSMFLINVSPFRAWPNGLHPHMLVGESESRATGEAVFTDCLRQRQTVFDLNISPEVFKSIGYILNSSVNVCHFT